jgi:4-aminobutyrate aminotransferase-like enzyme
VDSIEWANPALDAVPALVTAVPGPRSVDLSARMARHTANGVSRTVRLFPVAFERGSGVTLVDVDGNTYLDFASGMGTTNLGHAHPAVAGAVANAIAGLDDVSDAPTPYKVAALEALSSITPPGMTLFTFLSSGPEAMQAALRVARIATGHQAVVAPAAAGDGLPAELAALVAEAITNTGEPADAAALVQLAHEHGALFVADETAVGMGRTGAWFGVDHTNVVPDVMAIGRALGNGFPVAAIAVKEEHAHAMGTALPSAGYGGSPTACAAAAAVIATLQREQLVEHAASFGEVAAARLRELAARHPLVGAVRGRGALFTLELVKDPSSGEPFPEAGEAVHSYASTCGLILSAAGHLLRITPPIVMTAEVFGRGLEIIEDALDVTERALGLV